MARKKKKGANPLILLAIIVLAIIFLTQTGIGREGVSPEQTTCSAAKNYCTSTNDLICQKKVNNAFIEKYVAASSCPVTYSISPTCSCDGGGGDDDPICSTLYKCSSTPGRIVIKSENYNCEWSSNTFSCETDKTCTPGTTASSDLTSICVADDDDEPEVSLNPNTDITSISTPQVTNLGGGKIQVKTRFTANKAGWILLNAGLFKMSLSGVPLDTTIDPNSCDPGEDWYANARIYIDGNYYTGYYTDTTFLVEASQNALYGIEVNACDKCYPGNTCKTYQGTPTVTVSDINEACDYAYKCTSAGKYKPVFAPGCLPSGNEQSCPGSTTCTAGNTGDSIYEVCSETICDASKTCTYYDKTKCEGDKVYACEKQSNDCWYKELEDTCTSTETCELGSCVDNTCQTSDWVNAECINSYQRKQTRTTTSGDCTDVVLEQTVADSTCGGSTCDNDGTCDSGETADNCPADCDTGGDKICCYNIFSGLVLKEKCDVFQVQKPLSDCGGIGNLTGYKYFYCRNNIPVYSKTEPSNLGVFELTYEVTEEKAEEFCTAWPCKAPFCSKTLTSKEWNTATNEMIISAQCEDTAQCSSKEGYDTIKCERSRDIEDINTDAVLDEAEWCSSNIWGIEEGGILGIIGKLFIGNAGCPEGLEGTCRASNEFNICNYFEPANIFGMDDECVGGGLVLAGAIVLLLFGYGYMQNQPRRRRR